MGVPQNSLRSLTFAPFRHAAASQSTKRACGAPPIVLRSSATHKSPPPGTACREEPAVACGQVVRHPCLGGPGWCAASGPPADARGGGGARRRRDDSRSPPMPERVAGFEASAGGAPRSCPWSMDRSRRVPPSTRCTRGSTPAASRQRESAKRRQPPCPGAALRGNSASDRDRISRPTRPGLGRGVRTPARGLTHAPQRRRVCRKGSSANATAPQPAPLPSP